MSLGDAPDASAPSQPDLQFGEAIRLLQAGRASDACAICQQILAINPHDVNALHMMSVLSLQQGRPGIALDMLNQALSLAEHVSPLHYLAGEALRALGRLEEAEHRYQRAAELAPDIPQTHVNLGNIRVQQGKFEQALSAYEHALALEPQNFATHNNFAIALTKVGRLDEAVAAYRRVLTLNPSLVEAHVDLGNVLRAQQDSEEAKAAYQAALALRPDHPTAHNNLGVMLLGEHDFDAAAERFRCAIALHPDYPDALSNLGVTLRELGDLQAAIASYKKAIALDPNNADIHNNLGVALRENGEPAAAEACFRQALVFDPDAADTLANLATLLRGEKRLSEAISASNAALRLRPAGLSVAEAELIYAQSLACDWDRVGTWTRRLVAAAAQPGTVSPFILLPCGASLADQLFCARQWIDGSHQPDRPASPNRKSKHQKITLGYLSVDFRDDPVGRLLPELIECHDRQEFEVAAYCYGGDDNGETRRRLRVGFDRFNDVNHLSLKAVAGKIHADGVEILIDVMGYTHSARLGILTRRPSPIQVSYLGFPATMGANFIDYIIVDRWIAPFQEQSFYAERLVQLPECYQPSDTRRKVGAVPSRRECGLPNEGFVFCCFNNSYKITPTMFDVWMRLLQRVPGSVLWLVRSFPEVEQNLQREAVARGIEPSRLIFADRVSIPDYLARLKAADLFLDTSPYNAGATANDALWAGLPVLTSTGTSYTGRMAGSLLRAIGLPELVTDSIEAYEELALRLATEPSFLAELRDRLRRNRDSKPLFDMARYTRHLEVAYKQMSETSRRGAPPTSFAVEPLPISLPGFLTRLFRLR